MEGWLCVTGTGGRYSWCSKGSMVVVVGVPLGVRYAAGVQGDPKNTSLLL